MARTKIIDKTILDKFMAWLKLPKNNPESRKYQKYDYYLDSLFGEAINLGLITQKDVNDNLFDITWLKSILKAVATNPSKLKEFDDKKNAGGAGRASLTLFIKYVEDLNAGGGETDGATVDNSISEATTMTTTNHELNLILYGPPGTGKTYHTVIKAVEIIDGGNPKADPAVLNALQVLKSDSSDEAAYNTVLARFRELMSPDQKRIAFTTFHQSYGYEEFIEGIRPVITDEGNVVYSVGDGVFKEFCERARTIKSTGSSADFIKSTATVWKISLDGAGHKGNPFHAKCLNESYIRVGWDGDEDLDLVTEDGKDSARRFQDDMDIGDIVLSCYSQSEIDAIGIVTGDCEWREEEPRLKRFRKVKWLRLWRGKEKYNIKVINNGKYLTQTTVYRLQISIDDIIKIVNEGHAGDNKKIEYDYETPYVFIIDEINRGNVSKIFGELITLIEPSKRLGTDGHMTCILPYSKKPFGVPKNVYILGTMNTADRSLVQLDAALRRRFDFEEMLPDYSVIKSRVGIDGVVGGIDVKLLLETINKRISAYLDGEHQIGHSYFVNMPEQTVAGVAAVFKKKILPLLQEYFFEDYEAIEKILSEKFVKKDTVKAGGDEKIIYSVVASLTAEDYINIYRGTAPAVAAATATATVEDGAGATAALSGQADGEETDD